MIDWRHPRKRSLTRSSKPPRRSTALASRNPAAPVGPSVATVGLHGSTASDCQHAIGVGGIVVACVALSLLLVRFMDQRKRFIRL
ncbi:MAG: hypothetical protein CBB71_07270 [Rhodopirellula sp. TMED11]|nr:MAG: hypothetical protein CBB71_07270 [Rhodopirellula sp. TMED11]